MSIPQPPDHDDEIPDVIRVHRGKPRSPSTAIPARVAQDNSLSLQARGLLFYLMAARPGPPGVTAEELARPGRGDDLPSVRASLRELANAGHIRRTDDGRWIL